MEGIEQPSQSVAAPEDQSTPAVAGGGSYASFTPPHEREIATEALAGDYAHLAEVTNANPTVTYYVRYEHAGATHYGTVRGEAIEQLSSHYFDNPTPTGRTVRLSDVRLLAPLDPNKMSKVVGVAMNTTSAELPEVPERSHPRWFTMLPTAITGPGGGVEVPQESRLCLHEAEVVLVIGRPARHVTEEEAPDYIWGVTAGNDISEFDWYVEGQERQSPGKLMAKATDTFAPIGPAIAVGLDYSDLEIIHRLNGEITQRGSSADRLQGPAQLVAHLSRFVTLLPGDIIFTGAAPFQVNAQRTVQVGDELEVEIEGIGRLRNRAVAMPGIPWEDRD